MDLNVFSFTGRLGADPTMRYTPGGSAVATLRVAMNIAKEKTLWFEVTVWGKQAENVNQYLARGSQVAISGRLDQDTWEGKDGNLRTTLKVVANDVRFIGSKDSSSSDHGSDDLVESSAVDATDSDVASDDFPI